MAKSSGNRLGGNRGGKGSNQVGGKGKVPGGRPSKKKPSGSGRTNAPPKEKRK